MVTIYNFLAYSELNDVPERVTSFIPALGFPCVKTVAEIAYLRPQEHED